MDQWLNAVILGIIEGLTEFLPVSSTGHLIISAKLIGFTGEAAESFEIFIQLGAILAVVFLYWNRFLGLLDFKSGTGFTGKKAWLLLIITSFPAAVLGLLTSDLIKTYLFNPITVAAALLVGGVILMGIERWLKPDKVHSIDDIDYKQALMVGLFQCFALWPGMSRSASTIIGGMSSGLTRQVAAEYSFIAAVPIMILATGYDFLKIAKHLSADDLGMFAVGFLVSMVSAVIAVKAFIGFLQKHDLAWFGAYRIVLALICFWIFSQ